MDTHSAVTDVAHVGAESAPLQLNTHTFKTSMDKKDNRVYLNNTESLSFYLSAEKQKHTNTEYLFF